MVEIFQRRPGSGGGGGGAVDSVAGKIGAVVLNAGDVSETTTRKWLTDLERSEIAVNTTAVAGLPGSYAPTNAEQNVQVDWNEVNTGSDAFILNKPTIPVTEENFTTVLKGKLDGIATGAEVNVQADWNEVNTGSDAYIQNKPALAPATAEQNVQSDWNEADTGNDAHILNKPINRLIPAGGGTHDVLNKVSGTDYNFEWGFPNVIGSRQFFPTVNAADDSTALLQAQLDALDPGQALDGRGQTIGISSRIDHTVSNTRIQNMTITPLAAMPAGSILLRVDGTIAASVPLTSNGQRASYTIDVADNSIYSKRQVLQLSSDDRFGRPSSGDTNCSELVVVQEVDGNGITLHLYHPLTQDYTTAENAKIEALNACEDVHVEDVIFLGDGTSKSNYGAEFRYTKGCTLERSRGYDIFARFAQFTTSLDFIAQGNICDVDGSSSMYGFAVSDGCRSGKILDNTVYRSRHMFATAGDKVNRDVDVIGNKVLGSTNAAMDAHGSASDIRYIDNECHVEASNATADGLVYQGKNLTARGNKFFGTIRNGIYAQCLSYDATDDRDQSIIVADNQIMANTLNSGITIETDDTPQSGETSLEVSQVNINNNSINSKVALTGNGIRLYAHGATIRQASVSNNVLKNWGSVTASNGIEVRATTGFSVFSTTITGNNLIGQGAEVASGIRMNGADADSVRYGTVTGNFVRYANRSVYGTNTRDYAVTGNSSANTSNATPYNVGANNLEANNYDV